MRFTEIPTGETHDYRVARAWAAEQLGTPNIATIWIPAAGFHSAERRGENYSITRTIGKGKDESKSSDSTTKFYGIGFGPDPVINPLWDSFSIPRDVELPHNANFQVTGEWEAYSFDTLRASKPSSASTLSEYLVNYDDADRSGITDFLNQHAPTSSTFPGSDEVRAWITLRDKAGNLVAVAAIAEWESGGKVLSSVAVDGALRGKGLGALLMSESAIAARALGIAHLVLAVLSANEAAVRLYTSAGWSLMGRFSHYDRQ